MDTKAHKKIKILRIIARLNIGGPALHCILLTEGLNNGEFCSLLVSGVVSSSEADMEYLARGKGVLPKIIPELGRSLSFKNDICAFWKLYQLMKQERPDIIHTHTAKAGALGRLAAFFYTLISSPKPRPKVLHTFHGHIFNGYFGKFKSTVFLLIERILAFFTDRIIVVSDALKDELCRIKIGNPRKIVVVKLGLELDKLLAVAPKSDAELRIGIIGRLVPVKNHHMLFNVIKKLNESDVATPFTLTVAGDGELRFDLEHYVRQLHIERRVTFVGWQKDLAQLYSQLDIVVLTSLNEGTPVCLIEAMAAGKPVIATNVGGVRDLVDEKRGFLVPSGDVDGFANALKRLIDDEELRQRQGQAGREFVKNIFTKDRLIRDMIGLYGELLKEDG